VNLLLFRKNGERLKEMISDVRKSGLDVYSTHQSESDSEYDENEPLRLEFEKKVTSMLIDPDLQQQEIKRLQEEKAARHNKESRQPNSFIVNAHLNVDLTRHK
jgi:flagellar motor component MotA